MRRLVRPVAAILSLLTLPVLGGCNQYELFRLAGYQQESFSNKADVVFIVDNSNSMEDEAEDLALNFDSFINNLTSADGSGVQTDDLADAVNNYITYVSDRGRILDYQLAITTTSVEPQYKSDGTQVPGGYGGLVGTGVVTDDAEDVAGTFRANLLCEATCWSEATMPSDPGYECGTPPDQVTQEFLDCECGFEAWEDNCGAGNEEHLEAIHLAMCRMVDDPPESCLDGSTLFTEADIGSNADLVRENGTLIFVVVSDEGDGSRRMTSGDNDPAVYLDLFAEFGLRYRVAVIGPAYDPETSDFSCNSGGATTWGSVRLRSVAEATGGFYNPIAEQGSGGDCENSDFSVHLDDLGALLQGLQTSFPLQAVPDVATIIVYINGEAVPAALVDEAMLEETGLTEYSDGWSYDPATNAIEFHGTYVPDYNSDVQIYYRPLEGNPRTLPF